MNGLYVRYALAQKALELVPPLIRKTLLEDPDFREEYGLVMDGTITFPDFGIEVHTSTLFGAARKVLSGVSEKTVIDKKDQKWKLKDIHKKGELPNLFLSHDEKSFPLPDFLTVLSPNKNIRLRFLDEAAFNLPDSASDSWRRILTERALKDDEMGPFYREFLDTPIEKARSIRDEMVNGHINTSSLVPPSRRYFERLVGVYSESTSIRDYAPKSGKKLFEQLSTWCPYEGFLFSLFLSSHAALTDEINVDQLNNEDLVRAFDFLDNHGDRISQLGAIEVGLRVLPSRSDIEQILIRLIEQIRDDDVDGQASGFKFLSALFYLVDGELSSTRLLSAEPPFYRRLAALSQAALIQRQLVNVDIDIDQFSEDMSRDRRGQHYPQSLVDMRLEPRWAPELATASQMKADFFRRIQIVAKKYEQNITGSPIHDLVFGDAARSLESLSNPLALWLPSPLEGTEDTHRTLPIQIAEAIETQLNAKEVDPSSFSALVNFVLFYRIGTDQAELAAKMLRHTNHRIPNIENKPQFVGLLSGLATVAAVARSPMLADELCILVRKYRRDAEYALSIQEAISICLVAAASHSELSKWTEFVGKWLTDFAFDDDLEVDDAQVFHAWLTYLCHIVPELWVSCGRADAALLALIGK